MDAAVLVAKASGMVRKIDQRIELLGLDRDIEEARIARKFGVSRQALDSLRYPSRHPKTIAKHLYDGLCDVLEDITWKMIDVGNREMAALRAERRGANPLLLRAACAFLREAGELMKDEVDRGKALRDEQ